MEKIIKLAEKLGADSAEVCFSTGRSTSYTTRKDEISSKEFDLNQGYGLRVLQNGRIGFSYFIEEKDAERAIKTALSLSKFSEKSDFSFQVKQRYGNNSAFDSKIEKMNEGKGKELVESIIEKIKAHASPTEIMLGFSVDSFELVNSYGLHAKENSTSISCFTEAVYGESVAQCGYGSVSLDADFKNKCAESGETAKAMNNAKSVSTGKKTIVFDQHVVHSLLMLLIPSFNGERIRRNASVLCNKVGEKIGLEMFSLADDPGAEAMGNSSFDGEGTRGDLKVLVENGSLRNFLFDRKSIALMKDNEQDGVSVGNCARMSYTSQPSPGHSNLVVKPGEVEDLIAELKEGIYLKSFFGEHTANELTGEFSVSVDTAFTIKNGEVAEPVRNFVISGNVFMLLKNIIGIEKKQEKYFDIMTPKIAFNDVQVVG